MFVAGVFGACRGCAVSGPTDVRDLVPDDAQFALYAPRTGLLVRDVGEFIRGLTKKAGASAVEKIRHGAKEQLGFDPLDPQGYATTGIAGDRGLVAFVPAGQSEAIVAIGVKKAHDFDQFIAKLVEKVDGANKLTVQKIAGVELHQIGRPFGAETVPVLYWAHLGSFALLARAQGRELLLDALAAGQKPRDANAKPNLFALAATKLPPGDLILYAQGPKSAMTHPAPATGGKVAGTTITSVTATATGLTADTLVELGREISLPPAPPVAALLDELPQDAVLVAATGQANPELLHALANLPLTSAAIAHATALLTQETGMSLETDIMPVLKGPLSTAVTIANVDELVRMARSRSVPRKRLLDAVQVELHAQLASAPKLLELLRHSMQSLGQHGVKIRESSRPVGNQQATLFLPDRSGLARIGWAVVGERYYYGAGPGRLDLVLKQAGLGVGTGLAAKLAHGEAGELAQMPGVSVVVLRADALVASIRPLAQSADSQLGADIGTASINSAIQGALDVVETLGDVAIGLDIDKNSLRVRLREHLQ